MGRSAKQQIISSRDVFDIMAGDSTLIRQIEDAATAITDCYKKRGKTLLAGNGGSAADAQHLAAELVNRFRFDRPALASIALTTDTSVITAISNDTSFERVFEREIQALGHAGDVFIGISTSGNSQGIIRALETCRRMDIFTIGLTGSRDGAMDKLCGICIRVPSEETPRIQEAHILIGHIICDMVEEALFGNMKTVI